MSSAPYQRCERSCYRLLAGRHGRRRFYPGNRALPSTDQIALCLADRGERSRRRPIVQAKPIRVIIPYRPRRLLGHGRPRSPRSSRSISASPPWWRTARARTARSRRSSSRSRARRLHRPGRLDRRVSINAALAKDLRYHPVRGFAPITARGHHAQRAGHQARCGEAVGSADEQMKKNPGKTRSSSGPGSSDHLTFEISARHRHRAASTFPTRAAPRSSPTYIGRAGRLPRSRTWARSPVSSRRTA